MKNALTVAVVRAALLGVVSLMGSVGLASAQTVSAPWTSLDIGGPTLSGSASQSSGVFTIDAAGVDIWNSADQFHFVYQAVTGDVDIRARVDSVAAAHAWSKAGVMVRESLSAGAAHGMALVSAGRGVAFQRRRSAGSSSVHTAGPSAAPPRWVRLVRAGSRLTAYTSTDGSTWTTIGTDTITLGATAYVGLAVTSHNAGARTTAMVSNVSVSAASAEPTALPAGQLASDIGSPALRGTTAYANGTYTITAAGRDIWDSSDQFHFVYQRVTGNVEVIARVVSLREAHVWSKSGVMIRESLAANSRHASTLVPASSSRGYAFQRRAATGSWSEHTSGGPGTAPAWVRLVRSGDLFESYRSTDGQSWVLVGTDAIPMGDDVYVGIATTSHNTASTTTAVVTSLRVTTSTAPNQPPAVALTSPSSGAQFATGATINLAATASDGDGTIASVAFYSGATLLSRDTTAPYAYAWGSVPAGTYSITAVATDNLGMTTTSGAASVTVTTATVAPPRWVVFTASSDHATLVTRYILEIHRSGTTPGSSTPVGTSDLGKPTPASNGDITVDRATFFQGLATGDYTATVVATGSGGSSRSAPVSFTR